MTSIDDGTQECDNSETTGTGRAAEAVRAFMHQVRRRAQRLTLARTGTVVPLDEVHCDKKSCDTYQRLMEVILRAARDWKSDGGMSLEAWIGFRLAHTDSDASFFEGPLTVPYGAAMDYLGSVGSTHDLDEQRNNWKERGRDPLDFDTINHSQSFEQPTLPGDWSAFLGEERAEDTAEAIPSSQPGTDAMAEVRLFLTQDLVEVEQMVLLFHDRDGYTFAKIGQDLLPDHLFDRSGNVEHKARRIYLRARAKAQRFRDIDGTAL